MCPVSLRTSQYCPPHPTPPPDFCFLRKFPSYFRNYYFHFLDPEDQVACTSLECMSDTTRIYLHPVSQTTAGLGANLEPQRAQVGGEWFGFSTRDTSHPTSVSVFLLSGKGGHAADPRPGEHRQINSGCREGPDSTGELKAKGSVQHKRVYQVLAQVG